jgi:hypothetical protein
MDSNAIVEIEGLASAQLMRPDVAEAKWLAFPFAALAWGMTQRTGDVQMVRAPGQSAADATAMFVEQLPEFDAWRVGGGVAFRW